jgi:Flp pilus assembly protein TadG
MDRLSSNWFRRVERGQAVAETALALTVLLFVVLGFIDLGRAFFMNAELASAVNDGARYATINSDVTTIKNKVISAAPGLGLTSSDVTVTCYSGATTTPKTCAVVIQGDTLKVVATKAFTPITQGIAQIMGASLTLSASSQGTFQ